MICRHVNCRVSSNTSFPIFSPFVVFLDVLVIRASSVVECRTRNKVSPDSNPPFLQFRRLGIFVLSIDAPVDSAV